MKTISVKVTLDVEICGWHVPVKLRPLGKRAGVRVISRRTDQAIPVRSERWLRQQLRLAGVRGRIVVRWVETDYPRHVVVE